MVEIELSTLVYCLSNWFFSDLMKIVLKDHFSHLYVI